MTARPPMSCGQTSSEKISRFLAQPLQRRHLPSMLKSCAAELGTWTPRAGRFTEYNAGDGRPT